MEKGKQGHFGRRRFLKGAAASAALGAAAPAVSSPPPSVRLGPGATDCLLVVNGKPHRLSLEPRTTLLRALREILDLTGAKEACDRGACGACTVLADGVAVNACMMLALDAQGKRITTIEGLADPASAELKRCFVEEDALQCGFCTPGMVIACRSLLRKTPRPGDGEIREAIGGNLCRCGAYDAVVRAVKAAAEGAR